MGTLRTVYIPFTKSMWIQNPNIFKPEELQYYSLCDKDVVQRFSEIELIDKHSMQLDGYLPSASSFLRLAISDITRYRSNTDNENILLTKFSYREVREAIDKYSINDRNIKSCLVELNKPIVDNKFSCLSFKFSDEEVTGDFIRENFKFTDDNEEIFNDLFYIMNGFRLK